ncbi:MAG: hypothetical protein HWN66_00040 [Candidatus Helarchaeota archaeon]|nr:hypothetical protein [Candidatus Helarchaeota archaeon]
MLRKKIFCSLWVFLIFFSIFFVMNRKVEANNGSTSHYFTGNYDGDASILYFWENPPAVPPIIWNDNRSSAIFPPNVTNVQDYEFLANSFEIYGQGFINGSSPSIQVIADNDSARVNISNAIQVAQEFNVSTLCSVQAVSLYLNHSLNASYSYFGIVYIFDASISTIIAKSWENWLSYSMSEWRYFWVSGNVLKPSQTYYIVLEMYRTSGAGMEVGWPGNHSWKAEKYNNSIYNKGTTLTYDGSAWNPISNDSTTDMLCKIEYRIVIDPSIADLTFYVNNQTKAYQTRIGTWGGDGYQAYLNMKFPVPLSQSFNVTITTNFSIPNINFFFRIMYVYTVPVSGYYNATSTKIEWTMIYSHRYVKDAWAMPTEMFAFEDDWDYIDFLDPYDTQVSEIFFGPLKVYNQSYLGLFKLPFMGMPLEHGIYSGHFISPNYCHTIHPRVKGESGFQAASSFELGQTIKLEAWIEDSNNNPISGGNATINFTSPTGQLIYSETNLSSINGLLNTSEFLLDTNLETGVYTVTVFWTNGAEVGYYSFQITVNPESSMLGLFILIGSLFALAIVSFPVITYTRRKLQTRNWEKHLRNLFILTKDGLSIYGYSFGIEIQDPALISAALMAIASFVTDAMKSKRKLRIIDLEDKKVILSYSTNVITALISAKVFPIIQNRTENFTKAFEDRYGAKVAVWRGDQTTFKGTDKLIQEYFPVSMEDRITRGVKLKLIETRELLESATEPYVIINIIKNVTQLLTRYREIIQEHYMDDYAALIKAAEEKMSTL